MSTKEYFRKPYMTQGIKKHSDYMKAIPQKSIDVQGQIAPNIEFKKPYDYTPNTAQMIHYYSNQLHYMGGDPVPPLNDPSLLPHAPVIETPVIVQLETTIIYPIANADNCYFAGSSFYSGQDPNYLGTREAGLLFQNVLIVNGSVVTSAVITFVASAQDNSGVTTAKIIANDTDSAVAPTNASEFLSKLYTNKTSAVVDFGLSTAWVQDSVYTTSNFATVVQEVVDRPGWKSGNSILIGIMQGSATGWRGFYPFSHGSNFPMLTIKTQKQ